MGSTPSSMQAEANLLHKGIEWWRHWSRGSTSVSVNVSEVPLGNGLHIHTAEYKRGGGLPTPPAGSDGTDKMPLVAMHGYGTGLGIYYAAMPALAERWRGRVLAIDTLGCGLSSRPSWHLPKGDSSSVDEVEDFFIDGLERWRAAMKFEKMVLMGHSVGGYLAIAYAERYPQRVERLVLVSSVGTPPEPASLAVMQKEAPWPVRCAFGAWRSGFSPMTLAKMGLANSMLGRYVQFRFTDASWVSKPELQAYFVRTWTGGRNSGGGYAHATLLKPGGIGELAYARRPMADRLPKLQVPRISALYGQYDWMDWRNMEAVRKSVRAQASGPAIEIMHVSGANHNVQVDNPLGFVDAVLASCRDDGAGHGRVFGEEYEALDSARRGDDAIEL